MVNGQIRQVEGLLAQNLHLQKMHLSESPRWWWVFVLGQPASRHMIHFGKTLSFQPDKRLQKAYFVLILSSNESEVRRKLMLTQVPCLHSVPTPLEHSARQTWKMIITFKQFYFLSHNISIWVFVSCPYGKRWQNESIKIFFELSYLI